eukprot:TRINITY_DN9382_c0_g1_i2.p1 TRINITY_DN9382_c0_g1~~TRINITY_DN9382_c0_g1_i2.p1  ORF type:complete len:266 (-),score=66.50 TRINITY_DN9382_c0_g1_i2:20-817(-)
MAQTNSGRSLTLKDIMGNEELEGKFVECLRKNLCDENFHFYKAVQSYKEIAEASEREVVALEIWEKYVAVGSEEQININATIYNVVQENMTSDPSSVLIFDRAVSAVWTLMSQDCLSKFSTLDEFEELEAEFGTEELETKPVVAKTSFQSKIKTLVTKSSPKRPPRLALQQIQISPRKVPKEKSLRDLSPRHFDISPRSLLSPKKRQREEADTLPDSKKLKKVDENRSAKKRPGDEVDFLGVKKFKMGIVMEGDENNENGSGITY